MNLLSRTYSNAGVVYYISYIKDLATMKKTHKE